jgi:hypothetical protein
MPVISFFRLHCIVFGFFKVSSAREAIEVVTQKNYLYCSRLAVGVLTEMTLLFLAILNLLHHSLEIRWPRDLVGLTNCLDFREKRKITAPAGNRTPVASLIEVYVVISDTPVSVSPDATHRSQCLLLVL